MSTPASIFVLAIVVCAVAVTGADARPVDRHHHHRVHRHHHVHRDVVVVARPVRPWVRRPYYGTVVAGVALGTLIVASSAPPAPSPTLCWYWADAAQNRGYWDYCKKPK
ncbi:hypothetical protein [Rhodopseudomonas palustris]|uniref:hypothetical protein n=1 Tax=Rhodopseudomonas palustris TaxID=1076 RepID=UPI0014032231|nr:hypothetical protein [Rhodopseudomonas palustris]QLH71074.1 hypothetical protein HZF03_09870 [Rhodopseudomonas palustris]